MSFVYMYRDMLELKDDNRSEKSKSIKHILATDTKVIESNNNTWKILKAINLIFSIHITDDYNNNDI